MVNISIKNLVLVSAAKRFFFQFFKFSSSGHLGAKIRIERRWLWHIVCFSMCFDCFVSVFLDLYCAVVDLKFLMIVNRSFEEIDTKTETVTRSGGGRWWLDEQGECLEGDSTER